LADGILTDGGNIRIALIGAGFIGRIHGLALGAVNHVFQDAPKARASWLVDADADLARRQATGLGFENWGTDWQQAIDQVDAVIVAVPSFMHREIAMAAIARGRHVLCEKPVGRSAAEADEIADAAAKAGVSVGVGFTYLRAPMVEYAANIVRSGQIGRPVTFRGWHAEDYLADPDAPFSWRLDRDLAGRCGALGDLGWHIISIARELCGRVTSLNGLAETVYAERPETAAGSNTRKVGNEDWAAMLVRFSSGAVGTIEASRVAHGRKMDIGFELTCERGAIVFHGERANEIRLYQSADVAGQQGFRTIRIDATHPHYGGFIPAPAHGLGFNDLKTIELYGFLSAIAGKRNLAPDLDDACCIARICEAALESAQTGARIDRPEHRPVTASPRKAAPQ